MRFCSRNCGFCEAGVPPFVIFSDRSLIQMAVQVPQTSEEFLAVQGVGQRKLERYGDAFLDVIRSHIAEQGPSELVTVPVEVPVQAPSVPGKRRHELVGEAFAAGATLAELQQTYDVQRGTILGHLYTFISAGGRLEPDQVRAASGLTTEQQERVLAVFAEQGDEHLTPVFEALDGTVEYEELRVMRLYRMNLRLPVL
jgi:ATP-dependent DNA helicase RecQ